VKFVVVPAVLFFAAVGLVFYWMAKATE